MARPRLTDMLPEQGSDDATGALRLVPDVAAAPPAPEATPAPESEPAAAPLETAPAPKKPARSSRPRKTPQARATATPMAREGGMPPYLRFERKEARLRDDQLTELTLRARRLNKLKNPDADRITDNTLIRVAVDLLLARADELVGGDEAALRRSLGLTSVEGERI